ncbi:hypothetical protein [Chitinilyticum aquatile]|uniref:hypothetical protein n=1 Tax=Chitinilyticum aquatile TaxID=362520 RepID=UPI0003FB89AA|nr:hypothetical protein [Chitinilyticum aquatile]
MQKKLIAGLLASAFLFAAAPLAQAADTQGEVVLAAASRDKVKTSVASIDKEQRSVGLKFEDGKVLELFNIPAKVTRFDTLNVGDAVDVKTTEAIAILLIKGGAGVRSIVEGEGYQATEDGGGRILTTRIRSDVVRVDQAAGFITVKNPDGQLQTHKVNDKELLKSAAVGDQAELILRYTVAIWAE